MPLNQVPQTLLTELETSLLSLHMTHLTKYTANPSPISKKALFPLKRHFSFLFFLIVCGIYFCPASPEGRRQVTLARPCGQQTVSPDKKVTRS